MLSRWLSVGASTLRSLPYGYGPCLCGVATGGSLSSQYWKVNLVVAWLVCTTLKGMPYGGPPKSGWRSRVEAWVDTSQAALLELTGNVEMSAFHTLFAGNTWQVVPGTGAAATDLA